MHYPAIIIVPGSDINDVRVKLKSFNVVYTIKTNEMTKGKSRLFLKSYKWPDEKKCVHIHDIQESLTLPFFTFESTVTWNLTECVSDDWYFSTLDPEITTDVNKWFSIHLGLSNDEKLIMADLVNNRINWEDETLRIYDEVLIPTFKNPSVNFLLCKCASRKKKHIDMWCNIKDKLKLPNSTSWTRVAKRNVATTLEHIVTVLTELIAIEEIAIPAATKWLTYLTNKGHLGQFIKLVERRDEESQQHAKILVTLLYNFEQLYSFLSAEIVQSYNFAIHSASINNKCLEVKKFVNC